jgi:hypothetical protein
MLIMPKYVIEREFPNAGQSTEEDLVGLAKKSNGVIKQMGPDIQWIESYVTSDKIYCVYIAKNKDLLFEHAKLAEFPIDRVEEIKTMTDPVKGEQ